MKKQNTPLSRREIIVAGSLGLFGSAVLGCKSQDKDKKHDNNHHHDNGKAPQNGEANGGEKQAVLTPQDDKSPAAWSQAETLFWTDILMEHGTFFAMLMPGDELRDARAKAQAHSKTFADRLAQTRGAKLTKDDYVAFNRQTIDLVKPFIDYKHAMRDEQASGKLKSLVWPLFFEHTAREAERFIARLETYNRGAIELDKNEAIPFWAGIMGEHADFIAHLLDPQERELVKKALKTAEDFYGIKEKPDEAKAQKAGEEIVDFKTAAEKGINAGKIKSIIHPTLAAHVKREAVKFVDELKHLG